MSIIAQAAEQWAQRALTRFWQAVLLQANAMRLADVFLAVGPSLWMLPFVLAMPKTKDTNVKTEMD